MFCTEGSWCHVVIPSHLFVLSSCLGAGEQRRAGPSVGLVWRCLAMSSACSHVKTSTTKSTRCRWAWQDWLSNCSRYFLLLFFLQWTPGQGSNIKKVSHKGTKSKATDIKHAACTSIIAPVCILLCSVCLPSSLSSRVTRFSWTTGPCWWQRSCFYHLCLVCPSKWASTWPPSFLCVWRATSTTGILLTSPWLDSSNPSTSALPRATGGYQFFLATVLSNRCVSPQCTCGAVCQDGGWRCFGPGCSGLGLRAAELHQPGWECGDAGGTGSQGHT